MKQLVDYGFEGKSPCACATIILDSKCLSQVKRPEWTAHLIPDMEKRMRADLACQVEAGEVQLSQAGRLFIPGFVLVTRARTPAQKMSRKK
ncbi:MAG: hypothetical protein V4495_26925 [Pseudomonadota bacterium]